MLIERSAELSADRLALDDTGAEQIVFWVARLTSVARTDVRRPSERAAGPHPYIGATGRTGCERAFVVAHSEGEAVDGSPKMVNPFIHFAAPPGLNSQVVVCPPHSTWRARRESA